MFKAGIDTLRRGSSGYSSGLPAATKASYEKFGPDAEENGAWYYLVADPSGIRLRLDAAYTKASKGRNGRRFDVGTVVEVSKRRRSGWTRWLALSSGEGWLFDVSPKDRKVRMLEVEVQQGTWQYEVCVEVLPVLSRPQLGAPSTAMLRTGELVTAVERVRPIQGRGAFLRLSGQEAAEIPLHGSGGWVLDFVNGAQTLRPPRSSLALPSGTCEEVHAVDGRESELDESVLTSACSSPKKGHDEALGEAEQGEWRYVVLDSKGVTLRSRPSYDKASKLKTRLEEGDIVTVVERCAGATTMFLRVESAEFSGWAFDTQPGADSRMRMMEVSLEVGTWWYRVVSDKVALRSRCSIAECTRLGPGPEKGALVRVCQRAKVGITTFVRLKDMPGWIFDRSKDGRTLVEGPMEVYIMRSAMATVCAEDGVQLLKSPTDESWARTKMVVLMNAKVTVALKVSVDGKVWMEVSKQGGMQGWVPASTLELENEVFNAPGWARR